MQKLRTENFYYNKSNAKTKDLNIKGLRKCRFQKLIICWNVFITNHDRTKIFDVEESSNSMPNVKC